MQQCFITVDKDGGDDGDWMSIYLSICVESDSIKLEFVNRVKERFQASWGNSSSFPFLTWLPSLPPCQVFSKVGSTQWMQS